METTEVTLSCDRRLLHLRLEVNASQNEVASHRWGQRSSFRAHGSEVSLKSSPHLLQKKPVKYRKYLWSQCGGGVLGVDNDFVSRQPPRPGIASRQSGFCRCIGLCPPDDAHKASSRGILSGFLHHSAANYSISCCCDPLMRHNEQKYLHRLLDTCGEPRLEIRLCHIASCTKTCRKLYQKLHLVCMQVSFYFVLPTPFIHLFHSYRNRILAALVLHTIYPNTRSSTSWSRRSQSTRQADRSRTETALSTVPQQWRAHKLCRISLQSQHQMPASK